jgi:uncharacterized integral membrane protein (TIGR00698 family)
VTAVAKAGAPTAGLAATARKVAPGVLMAFTIAAASTFISEHYGAPTMLFALLIGMAFHFLSVEGPCVAGVHLTSSRLLKIGVALLGVRVTFGDLASLGPAPAILTPILIAAAIGAGVLFSRLFGRKTRFGVLTGGAVAICGASAALAIASVLPKREDGERDTLFTVIAVTSFSTVAMILYPILFAAFGFDDRQVGWLLGATIHDVAQVVGAGYAVSDEAGAVATYVKLLRVAFLPVVVIAIALMSRRGASESKAPFPWFAVGFAALLAVNSFGLIPSALQKVLAAASQWLLVAAIAALGMKTSLKAMADLGPRHIGVVVGSTLTLLAAALIAVALN